MSDGSVRQDIKSMLPEEITAAFQAMGLPAYRAEQVFRWLCRGVQSFEEMSDLPLCLRQELERRFALPSLQLLRRQQARDGTEKDLWLLPDGESVESVFMRYRYGNTVCISTQAGCRMGCAFCASTLGGKVRNLTASEMLEQVVRAEQAAGAKVTGLVLMGIGEPLDNLDNVLRFLRLVNHPKGRAMGMRHVSLSTCGLVNGMDALAKQHLQLTLSVSLHAPDNETRSRLMPVNRLWPVEEVLAACRRYFNATGRRVTFEYALIRGINDTDEHADRLVQRLRGTGSHVNLIRLNPVPERGLQPSCAQTVQHFSRRLEGGGLNVTVRRRLGGDIDAACGQLRRGQMQRKL